MSSYGQSLLFYKDDIEKLKSEHNKIYYLSKMNKMNI